MMNIQRFAVATGKVVNLRNTIKSLESDLTAVDATAGIKFDVKNLSNERVYILFKNTEASTAKDIKVLKPTTGGYAAADTDLSVSLAAGGVGGAWVETARYANTDGTIVCAGGSANVKAVVIYN
jgi:hypothetical protein